jgi:aldose 1-epimerase
MDLQLFGQLRDGRTVHRARLAWPGGIAVEVLDYGVVVRSLVAPGPGGPVETVLGFSDMEGYETDRSYQGRMVGRYANRIAGARFTIDGETWDVTANEGGNCLHGGALGFSDRMWTFVEVKDRSCVLAYDSPDGEEGFPGWLRARVEIVIEAADTVSIAWVAETDRATPVNLTHHLYFNLAGDPSAPALDHNLQIAASRYTPVRPDLIPTGELAEVAGTPFDLRTPRPIAEAIARPDPQLAIGGGIDHNWVLDGGEGPAVVLAAPGGGLRLELATDQPGVQVYIGQGLKAPFAPHGGIALEPQAFPDAINQPQFGDVVLRPGQTYRRMARYRFSAGEPDRGP